jgi:hypothetical protein
MGLADHMSCMYQDDLKLSKPDEHVMTQMALILLLSTHGMVDVAGRNHSVHFSRGFEGQQMGTPRCVSLPEIQKEIERI